MNPVIVVCHTQAENYPIAVIKFDKNAGTAEEQGKRFVHNHFSIPVEEFVYFVKNIQEQ